MSGSFSLSHHFTFDAVIALKPMASSSSSLLENDDNCWVPDQGSGPTRNVGCLVLGLYAL
jgi:hypothetical protein